MGRSYIRDTGPHPDDGFWWVSTSFATFGVTVRDGKVSNDKSAPISSKFIGQPLKNLADWVLRDPSASLQCLRAVGEEVESTVEFSTE